VFGETRIVNNTAVNLRNNMVSSIDEVRTLGETSPAIVVADRVKQSSDQGQEEVVRGGGGQKKRIVPIRVADADPNRIPSSQKIDDAEAPPPLTNGVSSAKHNGDAFPGVTKVSEKEGSEEGSNENTTGAGVDDRMSVAMKRRRVAEEPTAQVAPPKKIIKISSPLEPSKKPSVVGVTPVVAPTQSPVQVQNTSVAVIKGKLLTPLKIEDSFISKVSILELVYFGVVLCHSHHSFSISPIHNGFPDCLTLYSLGTNPAQFLLPVRSEQRCE